MSIPQVSINADLPLGVEGDFAGANVRSSMLAGEGQLVAGAGGVIVGRFGFARNSDGNVFNAAPGSAYRIGFIHRNQPGVYITAYLGAASMVALVGTPLTLFDSGDFLCRFAAGAQISQKVYASLVDGSARAGVTGAPVTNALITANTATNTTLTVTANTGVPITVGMPVSGAGIPAGTIISAFGTGTGGAGTYTLSNATTATATGVTVTATTEVETNWRANSVAASGELAMITIRS